MLDPILRVMEQKHAIARFVTTTGFLLSAGVLGFALGAASEESEPDSTTAVAEISVQVELPDLEAFRSVLSDSNRWVVLESEKGSLERLFVESGSDELAVSAAERLVLDQTGDWPEGYRRDFLENLSVEAIASGVANELPPSVTLAQAVLESGWGRSGLATRHNNLFGVKSGGSDSGVVLSTYEGGGDTLVRAKARFREYSDWRESLAHHNRLLSTDHRYADARAHWMDWQAFVDELAPVYATDPAYVRSVSQIVKKYDLDAWDDLVAQRVAHAKP